MISTLGIGHLTRRRPRKASSKGSSEECLAHDPLGEGFSFDGNGLAKAGARSLGCALSGGQRF